MSGVFCDYLRLTFPLATSAGLEDEISLFLGDCLSFKESEFCYRLGGGTVHVRPVHKVLSVSISGSGLAELRALGRYDLFLSLFADWPHRVTSLDAALDVWGCNGPDVIQSVYHTAKRGLHRLTRKTIQPGNVSIVLGPDREGRDTGTVYLGRKGVAEVRARVYDKRHERLCAGASDIGACVRYEITVSGKLGPTLADAFDPTAMFWLFAGASLLDSPPDVPLWRGFAEGYTLPPRPVLVPYEILTRRLRSSPEVAELIRLARLCGPAGPRILSDELHALCSEDASAAESPLAPSHTSAA